MYSFFADPVSGCSRRSADDVRTALLKSTQIYIASVLCLYAHVHERISLRVLLRVRIYIYIHVYIYAHAYSYATNRTRTTM